MSEESFGVAVVRAEFDDRRSLPHVRASLSVPSTSPRFWTLGDHIQAIRLPHLELLASMDDASSDKVGRASVRFHALIIQRLSVRTFTAERGLAVSIIQVGVAV